MHESAWISKQWFFMLCMKKFNSLRAVRGNPSRTAGQPGRTGKNGGFPGRIQARSKHGAGKPFAPAINRIHARY